MILLAGVTYFFGIAQVNGTIDRLIDAGLTRAGSRPVALPYVFFVLAGAVAAMGSPQAGLVLAPVGMPVARRSGVDPVVMAIAINAGISGGGLAPTSLFGIVSYRVAREAGIAISPLTLFGVAVAGKCRLADGGGPDLQVAHTGDCPRRPPTLAAASRLRFERQHIVTLICMAGLVTTVVASALRGVEPDIGVLALGFGALLALIDPSMGTRALDRIDWSTVFLVGGIVTFVGVLQKLGAVDLLGHAAMNVGTPLLAALIICITAATRVGVCVDHRNPGRARAAGRSSRDLRRRERLGADLRAQRVRVDRRRLAVLDDGRDTGRVGAARRTRADATIDDAVGDVDGRRSVRSRSCWYFPGRRFLGPAIGRGEDDSGHS